MAMESVRDIETYEGRQLVIEEIKQAANGDVTALLDGLRAQDDPANEDLARDLYAVARSTGLSSENIEERRLCVEYLLEKASEASDYLKDLALQFLEEFRRDDFSAQAHQSIIALYGMPAERGLLRVTGIAEVDSLKETLRSFAERPFASQSAGLKVDTAWNAALALARMGDSESARRLIERVTSEPDIVIRSTLLFRDLGYTRHPDAFRALAGYLDSTERLPTLKRSQQQGSKEASAAADEIAAHLEGSPDISMLGEDEKVLTIKNWLAQQCEIRFIR
jgi:hypothetical protein